MLTINGKKYVKNDAEFTDTLFQAGGTAYGYYKKLKNGIQLFNMQKELFAFIVNNSRGEVFAVSAIKFEGKARYSFGIDSITEKLLGLDVVRYSDKPAYLRAAIAGA